MNDERINKKRLRGSDDIKIKLTKEKMDQIIKNVDDIFDWSADGGESEGIPSNDFLSEKRHPIPSDEKSIAKPIGGECAETVDDKEKLKALYKLRSTLYDRLHKEQHTIRIPSTSCDTVHEIRLNALKQATSCTCPNFTYHKYCWHTQFINDVDFRREVGKTMKKAWEKWRKKRRCNNE